jgi:cystathionine beta-lyase
MADYKTVNLPIYQASTVLFNNYEHYLAESHTAPFHGKVYGTCGTPNQIAFEKEICNLEGGYESRAFPSGINAITMTLMAFAQQGDHVLVCKNAYGPTLDFCANILPNYGISSKFLPPSLDSNISDYIQSNTKVIFLESPGTNTFEIQDLQEIVSAAKKHGIITMLDNTWATPLYLKPLELGIDISIHSATKYISGHSDVLLGVATFSKQHFERFNKFYETMELFAPSEACHLGLRGLKTLSTRLKQHGESALSIAEWLEEQPLIEKVIYPALPNHPQHNLWKKYFTGATGVLGFLFKSEYTDKQLAPFFNSLELFKLGLSWGGYQSLIKSEHISQDYPHYGGKTIIRLSVGLEDTQKLKDDLQQGFKNL